MDATEDVKEADKVQPANQQVLFQSAMKVTKCSNELPSNSLDWDYYTSFPPFSGAMKNLADRMTTVMTKIYGHYGLTGKVSKLDLEEQLEFVSDSNDVLMERINNSLDEAAGLKKQAETVIVEMMAKTNNLNGSWNRQSLSSPSTPYRLLTAKNILRPQLKFKEKIINKAGAFVPKIKEKPHSMKPLAVLLEINDQGEEEFSHPYEFELERFTPDPKFLKVQSSVPSFKKVDEIPLVMVENEASLKLLISDLSTKSVIGVDLEAHSYRTFQGITCLMQISTDETDYIVDTLELWDKLQPLNEVFCNPKIVKVFHGADSDIEWLQRDFGLYVVNMFDTYHAAKFLNFAQLSLAFLLRHYCSVVVDKQFQLADWRIRPIPQEMLNYAREDTHYLGYIFERLKQDLKNKGNNDNLLSAVWQNSRLICLKRYRIPQLTQESHLELYRRSKKVFNERQLYALKELMAWRDRVAREEDESTGFVLPKHMMLQIADVLPREMQGILACCSPIPPLVRQHLLYLHEIIRKAREVPLSSLQNHGQPLAIPKPVTASHEQDLEDPLHCVHDLTHLQDIRDDLPTLLSSCDVQSMFVVEPTTNEDKHVSIVTKNSPQVLVFANACKTVAPDVTVSFISPFARYAQARAKLSEQEKADQARIESLRQHFISTVQESHTETKEPENVIMQDVVNPETRSESLSTNPETVNTKKKKKLPLSVQVAKKQKRDKKKKIVQPSVQENEASSSSASYPASVDVTNKPRIKPAPKKIQRKTNGKKNAQQRVPETSAGHQNITPFDYSQVDYQAFQSRPAHSRDNGRRGRGRGGGGRGRGRGSSSSKLHRKGSQKSMTYST